jgi:restriction system-associated AAA family ATPase
MKLLSIEIDSKYGSIEKGFKLEFRKLFDQNSSVDLDWNQFHPFCFAGLNGSGKSNVLEAIANIFYFIECCVNVNQPATFQEEFQSTVCKPDAFVLEYYICAREKEEYDYKLENHTLVRISKKEGQEPKMTHQPFPFNKAPIPVTVVTEKYAKTPAPAKKYLPDLIIGYSSGENEILSIPFLKTRLLHYDEYREQLRKQEQYLEPESNLTYIDYEMSQAVLLSNFIFQNKTVLAPLYDELGIKDVRRFRMNLNLHEEGKFRILDQYKETIQKFKNCSTSYYEEESKLTLDFLITPATKEAFKANFPEGIFELFRAFQILYTLNHRTVNEEIKYDVYQSKGYYTDGKVPIPEPDEKVFYFLDYYIEKEDPISKAPMKLLMKNLSDGEQQFLHTMGICLMLNRKSAVLLLDEPETHFNPDWRSKFIRTLKKSLDSSGCNHLTMDILITSHSPFIISDCYPDKVIVFEKGKVPINARNMDFRTYGTSIDIIMENIFKKNNTIGDLSRQEIEVILLEIKNRKELSKAEVKGLKERTSHLGDSLEKILLYSRLNELEGNV